MHTHTNTLTHTHTHSHTHTHTHIHTYTHTLTIRNTYCFSTIVAQRASLLRYKDIACLVYFSSYLSALSELGLFSVSIGNYTREKFPTNVRKYLLLIKEHVSKVLFHFWKYEILSTSQFQGN